MTAEIPHRSNRRGGPGWWMDEDGVWQPPTTWPESYAPIDGWLRDEDGNWRPPPVQTEAQEAGTGSTLQMSTRQPVRKQKDSGRSLSQPRRGDRPERSRQAEADIRAMLLVGGAIAFALLALLAALVMQSRAGAAAPDVPENGSEDTSEVIFAAETEEMRNERRREAALLAPAIAADQLAALSPHQDREVSLFTESFWQATAVDCLDVSERVLVEQSTIPVMFADNFECVPSEGNWFDPYLGVELLRTVDVEVRALVPLEHVHFSGGYQWTPATREQFINDTSFPATMVVLSAGSGHNPRNETPDRWRPANPASWCGYAVDWIAVKDRWELSVSAEERAALEEMLSTCGRDDSNGPHLYSMVVEPAEPPAIDRMDD